MNRRALLAAAATGGTVSIAGCAGVVALGLRDMLAADGLAATSPDTDQLPAPAIGTGPVTIEVYGDFSCPHCHNFQNIVVPELEDRLFDTGEVSYRHRDFPLPVDDRSIPMANAARAVQAETSREDDPAGEFFAYKTALFNADGRSDETLASIAATETAATESAVREALDEETYYPTLAADQERGRDSDIDSTPTVLVEGTEVDSDADSIVEAVETIS